MEQESVQIIDRRIDPEQNPVLMDLSRQFARAFGYTSEDLDLDGGLAQLLCLRVSQINNCTYCMNLHYRAARDLEIPRAKIDTLTTWWETDLFSAAEQAAIAYTEALTRLADTTAAAPFEPYHRELARFFSDRQISEIIGVVVNMNIWTRLKLAAGARPVYE